MRGGGVLDAMRFLEDFFHGAGGFGRGLDGRRLRQLHLDVQVALVLVGQEARRHRFREEHAACRKRHECHDGDDALADDRARQPQVAVGGALERPVEPAEEPAQRGHEPSDAAGAGAPPSAGLNVRALKAETMTEIAMVMANC